MKEFVFVVLACFLFVSPVSAGPETPPASQTSEDWIFMPAGAKPSYMGIHGGTMPVSLLVSDDGESLLTFVGRTGNDFIEALRNVSVPVPSFGNSTGFGLPRFSARTGLFAGNATATLPVFAISREALGRLDLEPFGLSEEPLIIEGKVVKPDKFPHARTFRLLSLPDYFNPRHIKSNSQ